MNPTPIQWCHASVNPVMGCGGCELWLNQNAFLKLATLLLHQFASAAHQPENVVRQMFSQTLTRFQFTRGLGVLVPDKILRDHLIKELDRASACYAGILTSARAGLSSGYPSHFETPTLFPGRMEKMARCAGVTQKHAEKTWLKGMPLMIFISDMGDALSKSISFRDLRRVIILPVSGQAGRRHIWLWLTKRPSRMADFSNWLNENDEHWPKHLAPMTSITSEKTLEHLPVTLAVVKTF